MNDASPSNANITDMRPDFLSPLTLSVLHASPDAYSRLVVQGVTPLRAHQLLDGVEAKALVTLPIGSEQDGRAVLAGLWLWLDGLGECHEIAQDLIGPTGSFWHAIMHRREGDFSNAKYWYARCADHRALRLVSAVANDVVGRHTTDKSVLRIVAGEYNPEALVDLVAAIHNKPDDPRYAAVVRLQQIEWEVLFHHCAYEATGAEGGMI